MSNKDIAPASVLILSTNKEDVDAIAVIDGGRLEALRPLCLSEKLGCATKGEEINTSLVAPEGTTILQAECKR